MRGKESLKRAKRRQTLKHRKSEKMNQNQPGLVCLVKGTIILNL